MVRTGLRDIAGWLNETAREKLTSKRCESTSLAEPRCPDAYTRSIVSLSLFFSLVLSPFRTVHRSMMFSI